MEAVSSNLRIWAAGANVPDNATRPIKGGRLKNMTDISPIWRYRVLTEVFGPIGIGWKFNIVNQWLETAPDGTIKAFVDLDFFYLDSESGEWSEPIRANGGNSFYVNESNGWYVNDECFKMATTDALSVACKYLGIGADVYWSADRTKYSLSEEGEVMAHTPTEEEIRAENRAKKFSHADEFMAGLKVDKPQEAPAKTTAKESEPEKPKAKTPSRSEIQKRLCQIRDTEDCQELKDLAAMNQWGTSFGKWSDEEIFVAYKDLVAKGVDI